MQFPLTEKCQKSVNVQPLNKTYLKISRHINVSLASACKNLVLSTEVFVSFPLEKNNNCFSIISSHLREIYAFVCVVVVLHKNNLSTKKKRKKIAERTISLATARVKLVLVSQSLHPLCFFFLPFLLSNWMKKLPRKGRRSRENGQFGEWPVEHGERIV